MTAGQKITTLRIIAARTRRYARDRMMAGNDEASWTLASKMENEAKALEWAIEKLEK